ncbi:MAG: ribonuclease HIII, partial [Planctomycetes bacterium]|nr:ribonuclease HIII [Planctomycetota bacterium]
MTFSGKLDAAEIATLEAAVNAGGFELKSVPHARFSARGEGVTCTLYLSGKCVVQGKGMQQFVAHHLPGHSTEKEESLPTTYEFDHVVLGSDESGKGDYFGPLVTAAVAFGPEHWPILEELRFTDSKVMTRGAIKKAAAGIRESLPHEIVVISPRRYNELYAKMRNLNHLLAWCHGKALSELLARQDAKTLVVDKFCEKRVLVASWPPALKERTLVLRTRAESNPAVAAASVLASDAFGRGLERLGREVDLTLPKG